MRHRSVRHRASLRSAWMVLAGGTAAFFACTDIGHAGYVARVLSNGQSTRTVGLGETFTVDIDLSSGTADLCNSAIFRLLFSSPGLRYESYAWHGPFVTGGMFDDSAPFGAQLPSLIGTDTFSGVGYPMDDIDIFFSNAAFGSFGVGVLLSLTLTVPVDFVPGSFVVDIAPDTFANGFSVIETEAAEGLEVTVVPAPGAFGVLAAAIWCGRGRRRVR